MNKKQRNRKDVQQNMRNRLINKRYTTTIKTLSKLFNLKINNLKSVTENTKNSRAPRHKDLDILESAARCRANL